MAKMPNVEFELKFTPKLTVTVAQERIADITFDDMTAMGDFVSQLKDVISRLIDEFIAKKTKQE